MIAHVLSGSVLPAGVEWLAAVLLCGGAFGVLATRRRGWAAPPPLPPPGSGSS